jgi:hypothetical protein
VVGEPHRRVFAVAYSRMGNDLVAQSTVEDLWSSLSRLWDAVYLHGQRGRVAIPLLGSELARIDALDRESALRMILLSFVTRSRENLVARELTLVIWPRTWRRSTCWRSRLFSTRCIPSVHRHSSIRRAASC